MQATGQASVVINEIHYNPPAPGGRDLEFVELYNSGPTALAIAGWKLEGGIYFEFPAGAEIPASGYVVVCRDRELAAESYNVSQAELFGNYEGSLDNDGDKVSLLDGFNAVADVVRYDDRFPWPSGSGSVDGGGASLERSCVSAPSIMPTNWASALGNRPTPLAANSRAACPPVPMSVPDVVINEIHYHPAGNSEELEEFIELHNHGSQAVNLGGWSFTGIEFVIPQGTVLAADGYVVIARNAEHVSASFGLDTVLGDFTGQLANSGERISLLDATGVSVDSVRYSDGGEWPWEADGEGRSLEKIRPDAASSDPASWTSSAISPGDFASVSAVGPLGRLVIQRLLIAINGGGEFVIDNVRLSPVQNPALNLIVNGDFEAGDEGWDLRGNASGSGVLNGIGVDGSSGLRILTAASCGEGCFSCSSRDSVAQSFRSDNFDREADYLLSFDYKFVEGDSNLSLRLLRGVEICLNEKLVSPGLANSSRAESIPPFISDHGRFPMEPTSEDRTTISARVRTPGNQALESVELKYVVGEDDPVTLQMFDDGQHGDAFFSDGVYAVELPTLFDHNTEVYYQVVARAADGSVGAGPRTHNGTRMVKRDLRGFYVNDEIADTSLPVYHVLIPGVSTTNPRSINGALNCDTLRPGSFVYHGDIYPEVGMRFRGNTACVLDKRNLKFRFNRGRYFKNLRKLNLQGMWTDKSLVREHLAWEFIRQLGIPYCKTEYVRVHLNGSYHGLYLSLEHPDSRYLERNGFDGDDCLYKAKQPPRDGGTPIGVAVQSRVTDYPSYWEQETCENEDFTALADFIGDMHRDAQGGSSAEFFQQRSMPEQLIGYQLAQSVLDNIDSFAKNHFLCWNKESDKWTLLTWDMDLVFGKNFDPDIRPVGTLNDCMLSPGRDLNPWFATSVRGNFRLHYFMDFFFSSSAGYYQRAYLVRLWDLLQEKYRSDVYDALIDDLETLLANEQSLDYGRWGRSPVNCAADCGGNCATLQTMIGNTDEVRTQLRLHRNYLIQYISRWHADVRDHDKMKITELMYRPITAGSDLEYIELQNTSGRQIDVSEWMISGGVSFVFPRGTVVPEGGKVVVVRDRGAFLAQYPGAENLATILGEYQGALDNNGDELRLLDAGPGYPATIDYVKYKDGGSWPEVKAGHSIELVSVTADLDNDFGDRWSASAELNGSPGGATAEPGTQFIRGDFNGDTNVNLSDAVGILLYLFMGEAAPDCMDAGDADDNASVNLTDSTFILNYLFLGGPPLPAPFPLPGMDLTEDNLSCDL